MTGPVMPQLEAVMLSEQQFNEIHAVCFNTVLSAGPISRCQRPAFFEAASALGDGWKSIFRYLTLREIYTFMISSPLWSQFIDINKLRHAFLMVKRTIHMNPYLFSSCERVGMPMMRIENANELNLLLNKMSEKIEIEKLDLSGTDIPFNPIVQLLQKVRTFTELNFEDCSRLAGRWCDLDTGSLPFVKKLNLSSAGIRAQSLPYLLYAVQNIEELDLRDYTGYDLNLHQNTDGPVLTNLRKLNLNVAVISSESILQFLRAAHRLEEVQIDDYPCAVSLDFTGLEPNSLLSLRSVSFMRSPLVGAGLVAFLKAAPNLQKIDLNDVKESIEDLFPLSLRGFFDHFEDGSLSLLQEIDLGNTDVGPEDIERLLKVAPNLRIIHTEGCPDMEGVSLLDTPE